MSVQRYVLSMCMCCVKEWLLHKQSTHKKRTHSKENTRANCTQVCDEERAIGAALENGVLFGHAQNLEPKKEDELCLAQKRKQYSDRKVKWG